MKTKKYINELICKKLYKLNRIVISHYGVGLASASSSGWHYFQEVSDNHTPSDLCILSNRTPPVVFLYRSHIYLNTIISVTYVSIAFVVNQVMNVENIYTIYQM